jgi:hypothetical protein
MTYALVSTESEADISFNQPLEGKMVGVTKEGISSHVRGI